VVLPPLQRSVKSRKYGITEEDLRVLQEAAGGLCGICGERFDVLCVDHDHSSGRVRGLLCRDHNLMLGFAKDRPDVLLRAAEYLGAVVPNLLPVARGTATV
jgi:hypothetical protein